jgi:hypothetical protein
MKDGDDTVLVFREHLFTKANANPIQRKQPLGCFAELKNQSPIQISSWVSLDRLPT